MNIKKNILITVTGLLMCASAHAGYSADDASGFEMPVNGAFGTVFPNDDPFLPQLPGAEQVPAVLAHAILVEANPEKEAVLPQAPETIRLRFNEGVGQKYLALAVVNSEGKRVDNRDAGLDRRDPSVLSVTLTPLPAGKYMVRYRVLSADGHVVSGKYFFTVAEATGAS